MDEIGARAFAAARAMAGVRFRVQGHDPATGLDCVGLVWAAYAAAGVRLARPAAYPLRGWARERVEAALATAGFLPVAGAGRDGDVVLIALAARQFHLGLIGMGRIVHAHAGLRRVVEMPAGDLGGAVTLWRLGGCPPRCN